MAFFKVDATEENVKDYTGDGGAYINSSGMYEVILKAVIVDKTDKGSEFINLWIEHQGKEQPIYQAMRLTNNDGSPNLGVKTFTKLCIVAGAANGQDIPDPVTRSIPMGKGGEEKECEVLEIFDDIPVILRIQMEYSKYEGKIRSTKSIRNIFRFEDKATASEIVNNSEEKGKQYAEEEQYADKVTYKDELTKEDIEAWIKEQKSNRASDKSSSDKKPSGGFGAKRTFGSK